MGYRSIKRGIISEYPMNLAIRFGLNKSCDAKTFNNADVFLKLPFH
jgi:hypothetical protein